jgi:AraC-like DNA-binding protein
MTFMSVEHTKRSSEYPLPLYELNTSANKKALPFRIHAFSPENVLARADFPHRHSFYQILYLTAGKGTHVIDFEPYTIQPIELYFISPGQVHFWHTDILPQGYIILFACDFLLFDSSDPTEFNKLTFFHSLDQNPRLKLTHSQAKPIAALLQEIEREYQCSEFNQASVLSAYLHILLAKIQRLYASSNAPANVAGNFVLVRRFKQLVSEHFLTERSVRAYADMIGLSAGYLAEIVKIATGQTPGQIIRQALVLEAKRLLTHTDLTIKQLSYQLAFDDSSYFGRLFKRETGMSPERFRQYIREEYRFPQNNP